MGSTVNEKIYVLHENEEWIQPLRLALGQRNLPHEAWHLDHGTVDFSAEPPEGVFYNRMSASSHTRGHRFAPELTAAVLAWLERHGRRVINGTAALRLELSKAAQIAALNAAGIPVPKTVAVVGEADLLERAQSYFPGSVILKPNRGGKGAGVRLFESWEALRAHVQSTDFDPPLDGVNLLQEAIISPERAITRAEFIGGRFYYALRVDTSEGFELCPADACELPAPGDSPAVAALPMFSVREGFEHPLLPALEKFLATNGIEIAGVEFITDADGKAYVYDINTNTNYNPAAESAAGVSGMMQMARFLGGELRSRTQQADAAD